MKKSTTKKTGKKNTNKTAWVTDYVKELSEKTTMQVVGRVIKVLYESDKVTRFSFESVRMSDNDKPIRAWFNVVTFEDIEINENDMLVLGGFIQSNLYKDEFTLEMLATEIVPVEE